MSESNRPRIIPFVGRGIGVVPAKFAELIGFVKRADDAKDTEAAGSAENELLVTFVEWVADEAVCVRDVEATARAIQAHLASVKIAGHARWMA